MQTQTLESYLPHVQQLSHRLGTDSDALLEIFQAITEFEESGGQDISVKEFFRGELAFYQGDYERALNHYLNSKGIDHFEFFCYRASAYVFKTKGDSDKALKFAKKALEIYPEDYLSKTLLEEVSATERKPWIDEDDSLMIQSENETTPAKMQQSEDSEYHQQEQIKDERYKEEESLTMPVAKPPFGGKEIKELAGIFDTGSSEELFSMEKVTEEPDTDTALSHGTTPNEKKCVKAAVDERDQALRIDQQGKQVTEVDRAIESYHKRQSAGMNHYLEEWLRRPAITDYCLHVFQGWEESLDSSHASSAFGRSLSQMTGGLYIRWNNKGIVINPGVHFLEHFHRAGLHVNDIDVVIATHELKETYADIERIYELHHQLNRLSGDPQLIHYYLNQKTFQELSLILKPHSKEERNAIHCLELFDESPEVEQIELGDGIMLRYFSVETKPSNRQPFFRSHNNVASSTLGLKLELSACHLGNQPPVSLGYISGVSWSPFCGQHLGELDVLVAGIGETNNSDYNKIVHLQDALGYYGVCSLFEDAQPKLLLCTEFGSRDGDLRLELVKQMRAEYGDDRSAILPADVGMCIDLVERKVMCSLTRQFVEAKKISVVRPSGAFGPLKYFAPSCCL